MENLPFWGRFPNILNRSSRTYWSNIIWHNIALKNKYMNLFFITFLYCFPLKNSKKVQRSLQQVGYLSILLFSKVVLFSYFTKKVWKSVFFDLFGLKRQSKSSFCSKKRKKPLFFQKDDPIFHTYSILLPNKVYYT